MKNLRYFIFILVKNTNGTISRAFVVITFETIGYVVFEAVQISKVIEFENSSFPTQ